ncbi:hypothetical protein BDD43_2358 [Mucilaginibacter gracilis]|uniref:Uncharacterized protein n=1 Tax=Mucilaginibacter gracilis TaxID=423350 RepID=A0A495IZR5_9SPHI|nr:hypothetical protein [Mucilaginibacter gracilis]RKR82187.1 hypothetical protein BDD43_2358 [Mucilaginibacter gracilis]
MKKILLTVIAALSFSTLKAQSDAVTILNGEAPITWLRYKTAGISTLLFSCYFANNGVRYNESINYVIYKKDDQNRIVQLESGVSTGSNTIRWQTKYVADINKLVLVSECGDCTTCDVATPLKLTFSKGSVVKTEKGQDTNEDTLFLYLDYNEKPGIREKIMTVLNYVAQQNADRGVEY